MNVAASVPRRLAALFGLAALLGLLALGPASSARASTGRVTQYQLPAGMRAGSLAAGGEGNLWFVGWQFPYVNYGNSLVGKVSGSGAVSTFPLPPEPAFGGGEIARAADGTLWFTEPGPGRIGRITPGGEISEVALPPDLKDGQPSAILATTSGAIWFTATAADQVVRLGAGGVFTAFPLPGGAEPTGVAEGFDGAIWVTERGRGAIARLAASGSVTEYPLPRADSRPQAIVAGPDEALWFTEGGGPRIGRISSAGEIEEFAVPVGRVGTRTIALGADDNLWYSAGEYLIGSISERGQLGEPACVRDPCTTGILSLGKGPDGQLWFGGSPGAVGGGGTRMLSAHLPGVVGTFAAPKLSADLGKRLGRFAGGLTTAGLSCHGGAAGEYCRGVLRMTARLPGRGQATIFRHRYKMAPVSGRRLPVVLSRAGRAALTGRGRLRVRLVATVQDGKAVRRSYLLRARGPRR